MPEAALFIGTIFQSRLPTWNKAFAEPRHKTISITTADDLPKDVGSSNTKISESKMPMTLLINADRWREHMEAGLQLVSFTNGGKNSYNLRQTLVFQVGHLEISRIVTNLYHITSDYSSVCKQPTANLVMPELDHNQFLRRAANYCQNNTLCFS